MNDDTRFLTENRHGQLLAEAETRRLANGESDRSGIGGALHRLGTRLFGARDEQAEAVTKAIGEPPARNDTLPAPMAIAADRTKSGGDACSGSHVHGQVAA